jgi:hypothetical protein
MGGDSLRTAEAKTVSRWVQSYIWCSIIINEYSNITCKALAQIGWQGHLLELSMIFPQNWELQPESCEIRVEGVRDSSTPLSICLKFKLKSVMHSHAFGTPSHSCDRWPPL